MSVHVAQGTDEGDDEYSRDARSSSKMKHYPINAETVLVYFSSVLSRCRDRVSVDTLRPLPMFLGLGLNGLCLSPGAFSPPTKHVDKSMYEKVKTRVFLNIAFFLSNYALVAFGVAVVVALSHPGMLLFVGATYALWAFHSFLIDHELIVFGYNVGTVLSISQRSNVLTFVTIIVIAWKCLVPVLSFIIISGVIILVHALLRDPKHIESSIEFRGENDDEEDENVLVERGDVI